jgi:hypothetical protein
MSGVEANDLIYELQCRTELGSLAEEIHDPVDLVQLWQEKQAGG